MVNQSTSGVLKSPQTISGKEVEVAPSAECSDRSEGSTARQYQDDLSESYIRDLKFCD